MASKSASSQTDKKIIIILIILLPVAGYFIYSNFFSNNSSPTPTNVPRTGISPVKPPSGQTNIKIQNKLPRTGEVSYASIIKTGRHNPFLPIEPEIESTQKPQVEPDEPKPIVRPANLDPWEFRVLGVGGTDNDFFALVDTRDGNMPVVRKGDIIHGYLIRDISLKSMIVEKNGRKYVLNLEGL